MIVPPPRPPTPPQDFNNPLQSSWETFYDHHSDRQYIDRHHLYSAMPEIFPIPPHIGKNREDIDKALTTRVFTCCCGRDTPVTELAFEPAAEPLPETDIHPAVAECPECHRKVVYASEFVVGVTTGAERGAAKRVEVPLAPPAAPENRVYVGDFGCGAGALAYPLCEKNAAAFVAGFDFASSAVLAARSRPRHDPARLCFNQLDLSQSLSPADVNDLLTKTMLPAGRRFDYGTLVFVLSALAPETRVTALRNIRAMMAPTGTLALYDYARGDFREGRFADRAVTAEHEASEAYAEHEEAERALAAARESGDEAAVAAADRTLMQTRRRLHSAKHAAEHAAPQYGRSDAFFRAGENTLAAFYSPDEVAEIAREAGWRVAEITEKTAEVHNRKENLRFARRFFLLKLRPADSTD